MVKSNRIVLAFLIIFFILMLNAYYYRNHDQYKEYPGVAVVINGYQRRVVLFGPVINTEFDAFYIRIKHNSKNRIIKVLSALDVEKGDRVEVLGLLSQDVILPEEILIKKKWSYHFVFVRSVIAILLVVYVFFSSWTFNLNDLRFRRREDA